MKALAELFHGQNTKRSKQYRRKDLRSKTRSRRTLLEQLEGRRLLAAAPFNETFDAFTGSGFTASPTAGQLDSDDWRVTGLSDGAGSFGGTHTTGDFARGASVGGVNSGGIYSFDVGGGNNILGVQPTGTDFSPGEITLKIDNTSGSLISSWDIGYDIFFNNNADRANSLNFETSTDDTTYTPQGSLDFTTPEGLDALGWQSTSRSATINASVPAGQSLYLRWTSDDVSGTGSRDEFGIDNVTVAEAGGTSVSIAATDANKPEGNAGTTPFTFTVTRAGNVSGASSVGYAVSNGTTNGADFSGATSGTVNFAATETSKPVTINVVGDTTPESSEVFSVVLSGAVGATIGTGSADGTIQDDDTVLSTAVINEFVYDHTGGDTDEYIEIRSAANENLSAYSVIILDGDGTAAGTVNQVLSLGTSNASGYQLAGGSLLVNILQNGSQTALLVKDFSGAVNDDLDTNNDGILDSTPWSAVIDDVALSDGGSADRFYSSSVLTAATMNDGNTFAPGGASRIPNGADTDTAADWARNDFDGDGLPSFGGETFTALAGYAINTPLAANFVRDPLTPALTITESAGSTDVNEYGMSDTFDIALTTNPTSTVNITVTPNAQLDLGAGAGTAIVLTFNNKLAQTVTVNAVDDALIEGGIHTSLINITTSSAQSAYNNKSASVTANIADNDQAAPLTFLNEFVINHAGTDIDEFVEVRSTPGAVLSTLTLLSIAGTPSFGGAVEIAENLGTTASGFLAITSENEFFPGSNLVLVEGFSGSVGMDLDVDNDNIFDWDEVPVPSGGLTAAPWISIRDAVSVPDVGDFSYGFTQISVAALDDGNSFEVGGASRIPDATAATTAASEWTRNDFEGQGLPNYPFSTDPSVPGTALNTPGASNTLISGLIVTQTGGSTTAEEGGAGDTLNLSLAGFTPTADVVVTITPDAQLDLGAGAGVAIIQTFVGPAYSPIAINVDAFDDAATEGPHSGQITFSVASADAVYNGGTALAVTVAISDNEVGGGTPQVVISEIMYNPNGAEPDGEWIEIVNVGSTSVNLANWKFEDEDTSDWGAIASGTLAPGQVGVIYNSAAGTAGQFRTAWGVPASAAVIGVTWGSLANGPSATNEILELLDGNGNQIDLVNYEAASPWPGNSGGVSIYLTNLAADNNDGANWAQSDVEADPVQNPVATNPTGTLFDVTNEGSPGLVPPLPVGVTVNIAGTADGDEAGPIDGKFVVTQSGISATNTVISYSVSGSATEGSDFATLSPKTVTITAGQTTAEIDIDVTDDGDFEGTENVIITLDSITSGTATIGTAVGSIDVFDNEPPPSFNPGDVIINEIMKDPVQVGDADGEYFEVFNTTGSAIDLNGWTISDAGTDSHTISNGGPLIVPAGGYLVLGINSNSATNGGVTVAYQYSGITLGNGDDEVILTDPASNEIDRVEYTDAAFPDTPGASMELLPTILSNPNPETDNDLGSNWQSSTAALGADFGTPGAINTAAAPEINVTGLTITIFDGDSFPSTADGTDFGPLVIGSPIVNQFVIENTGAADLDVSAIAITGVDLADFSISNISLPATITPGNSVTFDVTFNPTTAGAKSATVEITNTDADEAIYDFAISGNATVGLAPEILVESSFIEIVDGDATPDLADNTDFGAVDVGVAVSSETYFIQNNGTADLNITGISFSGAAAGDFSLDVGSITLPLVITPGNNASFTVDFDPSATGIRNATISIASNDADENPYDFAITGRGVNAATNILINEVDADTPDTDVAEFIELFGPGGTSLDGLSVVLYNGSNDSSYDVIDLDGHSIPADGYFVIGSANVPNVDLVEFTSNGIQNGADAVALVIGDASAYPFGTPVSSTNLVDAIVYDTADADDTGLLTGLGETTQYDEGANAASGTESNSRVPNGDNLSGFVAQAPTPGANNEGTSDTTPPTVTDVIVAGVGGTFSWTPAFVDAVDGGGNGSGNGLGYSVLGTTRTVPWYNVNRIYIQFSEDVNVAGADLFGVNVADYAGNFSVSTVGSLTTITMTSPFGLPETDLGPATTGIDKLLLRLQASAVTDLAGNPLAAEFTQRIDVLPGDGSGNGSVNNQDVGLTNLRGFLSTTNPGPNALGFSYVPFFDITANGSINNQDVGLTGFQGFDALPPGSPIAPPSFGGGGGQGFASLSDAEEDDWASLVDQALSDGLF